MTKTIYIIIPCYNESDVLNETAARLERKLIELTKSKRITKSSKVIFIDDGSKDDTWKIIETLSAGKSIFGGIKLSHNRGHQNALLAGILSKRNDADAIISMDADLQDDIDAIDKMIAEFNKGYEIVYGVRNSRKTDTAFKRITAQAFYKLMTSLGVDSIYNHADYRLMSRRALEELSKFKEVNLFLRGIIPLIGFQSTSVQYERGERFAGESKYPLHKMLSFAVEGITSFSVKPLRIVTILGFIVSFISLLVMLYSLGVKLSGNTVEGWTFTIISVWFIGGIQMLSIGVVGEYAGKIYKEVKGRPRFSIEKEV